MNRLLQLQEWYASQCNGDWEHSYGVAIGTLDNPGWSLEVELTQSELDGKQLDTVTHGTPASSIEESGDWFVCETKNNKFMAHGGPQKLDEMIGVFLKWAGSCRPNPSLERTRGR